MSSNWIFETSEDNTNFIKRGEYAAKYGRVRQEPIKPPIVTDKFGIREIYPTKDQQWFVDMADPKSDPQFRNLPTLTKQADGSWQCSASQVRLEAWSLAGKKWLNVEITAYAKFIKGSLLQLYSRGGHHSTSRPCEGSAIKGRFYDNGNVAFVKEINHPAYCGNRGTKSVAGLNLKNWNGFKTMIYNFVEDGKVFVKMENWLDLAAQDLSGNLAIKNNWIKATEYVDLGDWSTNDSDFKADCPPCQILNSGYRKQDEILNMPGGTATANLAAWRTDSATWRWKNLSVREITPAPLIH